jgi:hypothetical protein
MMQSSFAHLFFLTTKGSYVKALVERPFDTALCFLTFHQLAIPNDRDKKLSEPKPRGLSIRPILQMLHSATPSCLGI